MININEIFYTIQGEGPLTGKPSIFIRLSGCNLRCYWCDTSYTWLYTEKTKKSIQDKLIKRFGEQSKSIKLTVYNKENETHLMSSDQIFEKIRSYPSKHVVISGGEPLLQIDELNNLLTSLRHKGYKFEIETNGTQNPEKFTKENLSTIQFNVSPKLENSLNSIEKRYLPSILSKYLNMKSIFKFVVANKSDLLEIEKIIKEIKIPKSRIYLMPEGRTTAELMQKSPWLIEVCKAKNYNYTHRLHIDLFNKDRGV